MDPASRAGMILPGRMQRVTNGAYKATVMGGEKAVQEAARVTVTIVYWKHVLYNTNVYRTVFRKSHAFDIRIIRIY